MKRVVLALLALIAAPASAQVWSGDGPQPVGYDIHHTGIVVGNGIAQGDDTAAQGGTPPALAQEPPPVPTTGTNPADWIVADPHRITHPDGGGEAKARFLCEAKFTDDIDPIMMPGMHMSHDHTFIGAFTVQPDANYTKLRSAPTGSSCAGGPLNKTAYWEPSLKKELPSGVSATLKPNNLSFYYATNTVWTKQLYRLPRGLVFIGGVNPADPDNKARQPEIPPGWNWGGGAWDGFLGWMCVVNGANVKTGDGKDYSRALETPTHGDPWNDMCKPPAGGIATLIAKVNAPNCWDGHNLTSPNGRDHMRYAIGDDNGAQNVCPQGWWHIPSFEVGAPFNTTGWDDYKTWYLSSDRYGLPQAQWRLRGSTFHFDWMNGWDPDVLHTWLKYCLGVDQGKDPGEPGECDYSTISPTQRLISDSPRPASAGPGLSNDPVSTAHNWTGVDRYFPLKAGTGADAGKVLKLNNHPGSAP